MSRLYELIKSYYPKEESKKFVKSDAYVILDKLLSDKLSLFTELSKLGSRKTSPASEVNDESNVYQSQEFKSLIDEFERIYTSALKNKQLHNDSLHMEEELEDKLLFTQLKYESIMREKEDYARENSDGYSKPAETPNENNDLDNNSHLQSKLDDGFLKDKTDDDHA